MSWGKLQNIVTETLLVINCFVMFVSNVYKVIVHYSTQFLKTLFLLHSCSAAILFLYFYAQRIQFSLRGSYQSSVNSSKQFISGQSFNVCSINMMTVFRLITAQGKLPVHFIYMESDTVATPCRLFKESLLIAKRCPRTSNHCLSGKNTIYSKFELAVCTIERPADLLLSYVFTAAERRVFHKCISSRFSVKARFCSSSFDARQAMAVPRDVSRNIVVSIRS